MLRAFPWRTQLRLGTTRTRTRGPPDPEAKCLPLGHKATLLPGITLILKKSALYYTDASIIKLH